MMLESAIRAAYAVVGAAAAWALANQEGSLAATLPAAFACLMVACGALRLPASGRAALSDLSREQLGVGLSARMVAIVASSLWFALTAVAMSGGFLWWFAMIASSLVFCVTIVFYNSSTR
jgi:hypothetical protein